MTPDEKRIKFWELQGWIVSPKLDVSDDKCFRAQDQFPPLNHAAAVAAWRTLKSKDEREKACRYLLNQIGIDAWDVVFSDVFLCLTATPDQLRDAFLYAKGALKPESQSESKT